MSENTGLAYYQRNHDVMLNKAKDYYQKKKRDKYRKLSEEEKDKEGEYGKNRYHKMSQEKKQRLKKYQKNYYKTKMSRFNNE